MTLKQYIATAIIDMKALGVSGYVEFHLIVVPNLYKDNWEIEVVGTAGKETASTIKFTVNL